MGQQLFLDSSVTLTSVQAVLGRTTLVPPRDHDDFATECYAASDSLGPFTLRFLSNELGGPEHVLLGFELTRGKASKPDARSCASIGVLRDVETDNGLFLGMPVASLLKVMGRPKRSDQREYLFEFYKVQSGETGPGGQAAEYETFASLKAKAVHQRVVSLYAWYTFASYAGNKE